MHFNKKEMADFIKYLEVVEGLTLSEFEWQPVEVQESIINYFARHTMDYLLNRG